MRFVMYWYELYLLFLRDLNAMFVAIDVSEASIAKRLGDSLLAQETATRRQRALIVVIGVSYNLAALIGRFLAYILFTTVFIFLRFVFPLVALLVLVPGEFYILYQGIKAVLESLPYTNTSQSAIIHLLNIVGTTVFAGILVSLYTAAFITAAAKYQRKFM